MKKYKLLKDTYDGFKAGIIFDKFGDNAYRSECGSVVISDYVENNPEWFEEIKEEEDIMGEIEKIIEIAEYERNLLNTLHKMQIDAISMMSIEDFVIWRDEHLLDVSKKKIKNIS